MFGEDTPIKSSGFHGLDVMEGLVVKEYRRHNQMSADMLGCEKVVFFGRPKPAGHLEIPSLRVVQPTGLACWGAAAEDQNARHGRFSRCLLAFPCSSSKKGSCFEMHPHRQLHVYVSGGPLHCSVLILNPRVHSPEVINDSNVCAFHVRDLPACFLTGSCVISKNGREREQNSCLRN